MAPGARGEERGEEGERHSDTNPEQPGLRREKLSMENKRNQAQCPKLGEERKGPPSWLQADDGDLAQMFPNGPGIGNPGH